MRLSSTVTVPMLVSNTTVGNALSGRTSPGVHSKSAARSATGRTINRREKRFMVKDRIVWEEGL